LAAATVSDPIIIGNRFQLVDRELLSGNVAGFNFGYNFSCIMRSPTHALFWSGGGAYWSGGLGNAYGASGLSAYWRPHAALVKKYGPGYSTFTGQGSYKDFGERGGRLNRNLDERMPASEWAKLADYLGEDLEGEIRHAIGENKTLLIEGGGDPFRARPPIRHRPKRQRLDFRSYCDECGMHSGEHFDSCSVFIR
jgi:hypothetical protein